MRRPECQRARTALAPVIVLAAGRRGDPSPATPRPVREAPGPAAGTGDQPGDVDLLARASGEAVGETRSAEHLFVRTGESRVRGDDGDHGFVAQQGGG